MSTLDPHHLQTTASIVLSSTSSSSTVTSPPRVKWRKDRTLLEAVTSKRVLLPQAEHR
jgi:hypothetical protein